MNANPSIGTGSVILTGTFKGWNEAQLALVEVDLSNDETMVLEARSIANLSIDDLEAEVLVQFTGGAKVEPIVMGRLTPNSPGLAPPKSGLDPDVISSDDRKLTLRCGKASITLTKEGKIILRGTYISSRSSGPNRIKGGSVHLN